jgi:hypothetical protein
MSDDQDREIRTLKWRLKLLGKQLGKSGATIYALRNENAALRLNPELRSTGDYRRLLNQLRDSENENRRLREKLQTKNEGGN